MIKIESIKSMLKALKVSDEDIAKLTKEGEELDFTIPKDLHILSDTELQDTKTRVKTGHEQAYPEILGKELNTKYELGLSSSDAKDYDKLIAAVQKKAIENAKLPIDEKVKGLEASLKKLQDEVIPAKDKEVQEWQGKYKERETFDKYASVIPETANKYLTKEEHVNRVKREVTMGDNGEAINPATGQPYKDNLEKTILFADKVKDLYATKENWSQPAEAQKNAFSHSTSKASVSGTNRSNFDQDKAIAAAREKYDFSDPNQRRQAMAEVTTAQINAAKVA